MHFIMKEIGTVRNNGQECSLAIDPAYREALAGLDGFGYIQVIWWFDGCDNEKSRMKLVERKPYRKGPASLGTFATRSPERPNPIAITAARVISIDQESGKVALAWIDANDGTPVLDIKPYTPSMDRIEEPIVPEWCAHWPKNVETSGDFDWEQEFNF